MQNICSNHEREALNLLEKYADRGNETSWGIVRWIEPNDSAFRISWGRVTRVTLSWWTDGTGWHCRLNVVGDADGMEYLGLLMRDESEENQQAIVNHLCDWADTQEY